LILLLVVLGAIAFGFHSFTVAFQRKFNRSYLHWEIIISILIFIFSPLIIGSYLWWALYLLLAVWAVINSLRYGLIYGIGVVVYNLLTMILVWSLVNSIRNWFNSRK
jgi:peptidoglycan/LPS O-acetylase OafA/YrhL